MRDLEEPIRLAGAVLGEYRHVCAFFHTPEEEYRVLVPFIKDGIARGDKAFHVVSPKMIDEHRRRLGSAGIDVPGSERNGQLDLRDWDDVYFPGARFDQNRTLSLWQTVFDQAQQQGFPLTRLVAHMEWALEDRQGVNDLLE
jgi:MEDS: MEthanogen/methylotroph, DcmR Sensory domain